MAQEFGRNSSSNSCRAGFRRYKDKAEEEHLDFDTDNSGNCNVPFAIAELCGALGGSHDAAAGPGGVHCQLLGHLPGDSHVVLLDIFSGVWASGGIPGCWRGAAVIPGPGGTQGARPIVIPYL